MNKKIAGLGFPVFFFLPWLGFILSLFNLRSKVGAFIYIAFAMILGYAISFTDTSVDSYRYAQAFKLFDTTLDYNKLVELYQNGEQRDIYRLVLFYFTSLFSHNPKVVFALAGLIYGIFSYLALRVFVQERGEGRWDRYMLILGLVFYTYCSLSNINGFRFWTGALILFYATYNFILQKKTVWVIGILLTPLIHYGFVLMVPVLIAYRFTHHFLYTSKGVRPILLYVFVLAFIASWVLSTNAINLDFFAQSSPLSGSVGNRIDYLNSEDIAELVENRKDSSLFLNVRQYFDYAIKFYVFIAVLFLYKLNKGMKENKALYGNLLTFVLFFYSFAFIAASFPSGGRFLNIAHLFLVLLMCKFYTIYKRRNIRRLILLALPVFSFNIAFTNGMLLIMLLSPTFWYGNVFWIIIEGLDFYI
jgi:hypothetical protein